MEHDSSLSFLQEPSTFPSPKTNKRSPRPTFLFLYDHFIIIFSCMSRSSKWFFRVFHLDIFKHFSSLPCMPHALLISFSRFELRSNIWQVVQKRKLVIMQFLQPVYSSSSLLARGIQGGADKSLARPGKKQATATKLWIYSTYSPRSSIHFLARFSDFCKPLKKIQKFVHPTRSPRQQ